MKSKSKAYLGCVGMLVIVGAILYGIWSLISSTQYFTKTLGGTTVIELPVGKKLVPYTVQWEPKGSNIWYLTEDAEAGYSPKN